MPTWTDRRRWSTGWSRATNDHDLDALVGVLRRRLRERDAGAPGAGLPRARPGAPELGADLRASSPTCTPRSALRGRRRHGLDGVGDDGHPARRDRAPHARRHRLRRRATASPRRARFYLEPVDDEARHRRRRRARAGRARMILVAGGTGRLGTLVVARARRRDGLDVRVLTRDADAGPPPRRRGDRDRRRRRARPASLDAAIDGVDDRRVRRAGLRRAGPGDARRRSTATATRTSSTPPPPSAPTSC